MIGRRRVVWRHIAFAVPLIVVGLLAMHGLTGSKPTAERAGHSGHEMTSPRSHEMPLKGSHGHGHVHEVALCLWVLIVAFALVALRQRGARLSEVICASLQSIARPGRALMRAPPVSARLSLVGVSLR
jgi:hypothetical protein